VALLRALSQAATSSSSSIAGKSTDAACQTSSGSHLEVLGKRLLALEQDYVNKV
jgi:hypothetical protein